jgi:orotidine-5'-phosphate decarboxylase
MTPPHEPETALPPDAAPRNLPPRMADRLIVALDLPDVPAAAAMADRLADAVSFFKIGLGLQFRPGVDALIDRLLAAGKHVFLDAKIYDIPETVGRAVAAAAKSGSALRILAVTVLTSLDDAALRDMGYALGALELVEMRARRAVACGADGIIASADDNPDAIRRLAGSAGLLVATPGIRQSTGDVNDHRRSATPGQAIANGADYLVVGRPIVAAADPLAAAGSFIAEMEAARPS